MAEEITAAEAPAVSVDPSTELASQNLALAFERTVMSCDRTLMSVVRTSLSLIGFGFTIFTFFHTLGDKFVAELPSESPRRFGGALIALGLIALATGLWYHSREWQALKHRRQMLFSAGLIDRGEMSRQSNATLVALLLLLIGLLAMLSVALRVGPF